MRRPSVPSGGRAVRLKRTARTAPTCACSVCFTVAGSPRAASAALGCGPETTMVRTGWSEVRGCPVAVQALERRRLGLASRRRPERFRCAAHSALLHCAARRRRGPTGQLTQPTPQFTGSRAGGEAGLFLLGVAVLFKRNLLGVTACEARVAPVGQLERDLQASLRPSWVPPMLVRCAARLAGARRELELPACFEDA